MTTVTVWNDVDMARVLTHLFNPVTLPHPELRDYIFIAELKMFDAQFIYLDLERLICY